MNIGRGYARVYVDGSEVNASECEVKIRMNEGWDEAVFVVQADTLSFDLGSSVSIDFVRGSYSINPFIGEVIGITQYLKGKDRPAEWEITAWGKGSSMKGRRRSKFSAYTTESNIINTIMNPVVSDLAVDTSKVVPNNTVSYKLSSDELVWDAIRRFCHDHTINFFVSTGGTVHFFKGAYETLPTSFSNYVVREKNRDIMNIRNKVVLYSYGLNPRGKDHWTESLDGWSVYSYDTETGSWEVAGKWLRSSSYADEGDYYLDFRTPPKAMPESPYNDLWIVLDLGTTISDFERLCMSVRPVYTYEVVPKVLKGKIKIYLMDSFHSSPPSYNYALGETKTYEPSKIDITEDKLIDWIRVILKKDDFRDFNFSWDITHIGFFLEIDDHDRGYDGVLIDRLYIEEAFGYEYNNTTSQNNYGVWEYIPEKTLYKGVTKDYLESEAKRLVDPYAKPEESIRNLRMEGTAVLVGRAYTFTFEDYSKEYLVNEVEHEWNGSNWYTNLILSSSEVKHPVRKRVSIIRDLSHQVRRLNNIVEDVSKTATDYSDNITIYISGQSQGLPGSYIDGEWRIENLNITVESGGSFTIEKIDSIGVMNVDTIQNIDTIEYVGVMTVGTISNIEEITNVERMKVNVIESINRIEDCAYAQIGTITNVEEISNVAYLEVETIENVENLTCSNFNVTAGTIGTLKVEDSFIGTQVIHGDAIQDLTLDGVKIQDGVIAAKKLVVNIHTNNLLKYSSFEEPEDAWKGSYWITWPTYGFSSTLEAFKGTVSFRYRLSTVDPYLNVLEHTFNVGYGDEEQYIEPNSPYIFSVYGIVPQKGTIWLEAENASTIYSDQSTLTYSFGQWKRCHLVFMTPSSGTVVIRVKGKHADSSTYYAYLDCIMLEKTPSTFNIYPSVWTSKEGLEMIYDGSQVHKSVELDISGATIENVKIYGYIEGSTFNFTEGTINNVNISGVIEGSELNITNVGYIKDLTVDGGTLKNISDCYVNNLVVTDGSISTLSIVSIDSTEVITNNNIKQFEIHYDRLKVPPIGVNRVINGGFEYGIWPNNLNFTITSINPFLYKGKYSAYFEENHDAGYIETNYIPCHGETVLVASYYMWKSNNCETEAYIRFYDSNKSFLSEATFGTHVGIHVNWREYLSTISIPGDAWYLKYRITVTGAQTIGGVAIDNVNLVFGDQYTSFTDWTVARDRWLPDFYFECEPSGNSITYNGTAYIATLELTLTYDARILIFAGAKIDVFPEVYNQWYRGHGDLFVVVNGETLEINPLFGFNRMESNPSQYSYDIYMYSPVVIESTYVPSGVSTIYLGIRKYSGDAIQYSERYIRVIAGSYFKGL
ncbi:MAG: hypothetical protein DRI61_00660 [Chloroflexi bacterium]|nr:MAG: hypothetical protein DRI61_00660 [Chloroflexota bacterium]